MSGIDKGLLRLSKTEEKSDVVEMAEGWIAALDKMEEVASKGEGRLIAQLRSRVRCGLQGIEFDAPFVFSAGDGDD